MAYYNGPKTAEYLNNLRNEWYQRINRVKLPKIGRNKSWLNFDYYTQNIANPIPASTEWTEISPGVWQCTGNNVGAATTLILTQESDGLVIGQAYLLSATITGTADILIRSGATTLDTNWDGSPKIFIPNNGNFNIFQRVGGYTIQDILIREAVIIATGVTSFSEVGSAVAESQDAVAALGVESASEIGMALAGGFAALGAESASEVGQPVAASIDAPIATGVESASEVAIVPADTTAPTMTGDTYTEGTFTFAATISEPATMHYLVSVTPPTTTSDIILGTGLFKTTVEVTAGANNNYLELSGVPAGTYWFSALPVDAFGNADFAEAHVGQYVFPGGYVATGIESASEAGSAAVSSIDASAASGVESASEVATAPVPTISATATGVESASEIGSAAVASVDAPAATGVESASEIGAASQESGLTGPDDDFENGSLEDFWTATTAGTSSIVETGGQLVITCPTDIGYDWYSTSSVNAPRVEQSFTPGSGDFTITADFSASNGGSGPSAGYQGHGFLIMEDNNKNLRFNAHHNGSGMIGFCATMTAGTSSTQYGNSITSTHWKYLRVTRLAADGGQWRFYGSPDGVSFTSLGAGFSFAMTINKMAIFAHRSSGAGQYVANIEDIAFA